MSNTIYPSSPLPIRGLAFNSMKSPEDSTILQVAANAATVAIPQYIDPVWHWLLSYEYVMDRPNDLATGNTYTDYRLLQGFWLARNGRADDFLYSDPTDHSVGPALISAAPNAQAQLQIVTDTTDPISVVTVNSAGTGFAVGDYLQVAGGGGSGGILSVATISGGGGTGPIATFNIVSGGQGYTTTTNVPLNILSGTGSGSPTANITATSITYSPIQRNFGGLFYEDITDLNGAITVYDNGALKVLNTDYVVGGPGLAFPGQSYLGLYLRWINVPTGPVTVQFNFYFRVRFEMDTVDFELFLDQLWTVGGENSKNGTGYIKLMTARAPGI